MGVLQSLARGTVLAAFGIGGWLLEQSVGYLGGILASVTGAALPVEVAWMLACGLGIVIGDILAVLAGNDVEVGRAAGIAKGLIASIGGLIGLTFGDGYLGFVLGIWVPTVISDLAGY